MFDIVAAHDAVILTATSQNDLGSQSVPVESEGHAIVGFHSGLFRPRFCLSWEKVFERAVDRVLLQFVEAFQ